MSKTTIQDDFNFQESGVDYCNSCIIKQIPSDTFKFMLKERGNA